MAVEKERIEKIVLIGMVACIAGAAVWMFYLKPKIGVITGGRAKIKELRAKKDEAEKIIGRAGRVGKRLEDLKIEIAQFDEDIPPETMDEWILNNVNAICRELNVRYGDWKPQEARDFKEKVMKKSYRRKRVNLKMNCDYHTLGRFLNKLENASPFISIEDLTIRDSGIPQKQEVQFSISYVVRKE